MDSFNNVSGGVKKVTNEKKLKHLEFILGIINRQAQNSFMLKSWTVTIVAALFAFANRSDEMDSHFLWIAIIPVFFFWLLDGYFLRQERLFRHLYNHVRTFEENQIDFSMRTDHLNVSESKWIKVCLSNTLLYFYGPLFIVIIVAMVWLG